MSASFSDIIEQRFSRRGVVKGLAALGAAASLPYRTLAMAEEAVGNATSSLNFNEVARGMDGTHHIAEGYDVEVLVRWGDKVLADAPAFDPMAQSSEAQAKQFGFNNDFIAYFPLSGDSPSSHGLLCVNHEYTSAPSMFKGVELDSDFAELPADYHRTEMMAQGVSILEVVKSAEGWKTRTGRLNRRITLDTPMRLSGAAAGHKRLQTSADPEGKTVLGTLGNCAGGMTPWGTYLTCEENIDFFFHMNGYEGAEKANHLNMTIGKQLLHRWDLVDKRFDVLAEPHEPNRFGWVVEIDPFDVKSTPVKRTALGRFKHECASTVVNHDGRLVVFMGDDENHQHIYRFVSRWPMREDNRTSNAKLLDEGTLYVARFHEDGTLVWLPLIYGEGELTYHHDFNSQADVLIETRRAAKLSGATPMDRPEDVEVNPITGSVFACMTNNVARTETDAVNRRAPNPMGYVLEMIPAMGAEGHDYAAETYRWEIFLEGGDPEALASARGFYQAAPSDKGWLACPDNMTFDKKGRIWITTDGQPKSIKESDGIFAAETKGEFRGQTRCFFRAPEGAEVTGPMFTPDNKTLFISIQHPAEGSTFDDPSTRWPDDDASMPPRPAIITITKKDGGVIGD